MGRFVLQQVRRHHQAVMLVWFGFIGALSAFAQWYEDPIVPNPTLSYSLPHPFMCSDGFNGAYFASWYLPGIYRQGFLGHINADGNLSYDNSPPPLQNLWPIDSVEFYRHGEITVTPVEPTGSVIVTAARIWMDDESIIHFGGFTFTKFDTLGRSGFNQVVITDTLHTLRGRLAIEIGPEGGWDVHSDGFGGIHTIITSTSHSAPCYYNHLENSGQWTFDWPGFPITDGTNGNVLRTVEDGFGGVFVFVRWNADSPQFPNQTTAIRFASTGIPAMEDAVPLPRASLLLGSCILLEPGRILVLQDSVISQEEVQHFLFLLDTNGVNQWEPNGRSLSPESGASFIYLKSDKQGGFFHHVFVSSNGRWVSHRYNGNVEHIAQSPPSVRQIPRYADGTGGAYDVNWTSSPIDDPQFVSVFRWNPDFQPAWPDSVLGFQYPAEGDQLGVVNQIITEDHALIGAAPWFDGLRLFRVGSDGRLGPRTDVSYPNAPMIADFRLISVYPNPFNGPVTVQYESQRGKAGLQIAVYDLLGRKVLSEQLADVKPGENHWTLYPSDLASGSYYITLETTGIEVRPSAVSASRVVLIK